MGVEVRSRSATRVSTSADSSARESESSTSARVRGVSLAPMEKLKEALRSVEEVRKVTANGGLRGLRAGVAANGYSQTANGPPVVITSDGIMKSRIADSVRLPSSLTVRRGPTIPYGGNGAVGTNRPSSAPTSRHRHQGSTGSNGLGGTPALRAMASATGSSKSYARMAERRRSISSTTGLKRNGGSSSLPTAGGPVRWEPSSRSVSSDLSATSSASSRASKRTKPSVTVATNAYRRISLSPSSMR